MTKENLLFVRAALEDDIPEIVRLERDVWGEHGASQQAIASRIRLYPHGNPVCLNASGELVGFGSTMIIGQYPQKGSTWDTITDNGTISQHDPGGKILYGVNASARKGGGSGIFDALFRHCLDVGIREHGCSLFVLGARVPGYRTWRDKTKGTIEEYLRATDQYGRSIDPEVRLYQQAGLKADCPMKDYFPCPDSLDWGVLMTMEL